MGNAIRQTNAATQSFDDSINEGFQTPQESVLFPADIWMGVSNRPDSNKKQKYSDLNLKYLLNVHGGVNLHSFTEMKFS